MVSCPVLEAVLFDLDDTLLRTETDEFIARYFQALGDYFQALGGMDSARLQRRVPGHGSHAQAELWADNSRPSQVSAGQARSGCIWPSSYSTRKSTYLGEGLETCAGQGRCRRASR